MPTTTTRCVLFAICSACCDVTAASLSCGAVETAYEESGCCHDAASTTGVCPCGDPDAFRWRLPLAAVEDFGAVNGSALAIELAENYSLWWQPPNGTSVTRHVIGGGRIKQTCTCMSRLEGETRSDCFPQATLSNGEWSCDCNSNGCSLCEAKTRGGLAGDDDDDLTAGMIFMRRDSPGEIPDVVRPRDALFGPMPNATGWGTLPFATLEELEGNQALSDYLEQVRSKASSTSETVRVPFRVGASQALVWLPRVVVGDDVLWLPGSGAIKCKGCYGSCRRSGSGSYVTCETDRSCRAALNGCSMLLR